MSRPGWVGWTVGRLLGRHTRDQPRFTPGRLAAMAAYALLAGALGGLLLAAFAEVAQWIRQVGRGYNGSWIASALATALLLKFYSLTVVGHIGLMGRYFSHDSREWWSRLGGWVLMFALVWAAVFSNVFIAPAFFRWAPQAFVAAGGVTWILSTIAGMLMGRGEKTAVDTRASWRDRAALPRVRGRRGERAVLLRGRERGGARRVVPFAPETGPSTRGLLVSLGTRVREVNIPILVDPVRSREWSDYGQVSLIKANWAEATEAASCEHPRPLALAQKLADAHNCDVVITLGRHGMVCAERDGSTWHLPATPTEVRAVCGAGDTVFAALPEGIFTGQSLQSACRAAMGAAGRQVGTVRIAAVA